MLLTAHVCGDARSRLRSHSTLLCSFKDASGFSAARRTWLGSGFGLGLGLGFGFGFGFGLRFGFGFGF